MLGFWCGQAPGSLQIGAAVNLVRHAAKLGIENNKFKLYTEAISGRDVELQPEDKIGLG